MSSMADGNGNRGAVDVPSLPDDTESSH